MPQFQRVCAIASMTLVFLALAAKSDVRTKYPEPEDGTVHNGVFQDEYFGLTYALPSGWVEDLKGPAPSSSGYYSLAALKPEGDLSATIQISAQDNFFAAQPPKDAADFLAAMKRGLDPSLSATEAIATPSIGGLRFARLDYSGAGLNHTVLATEIRCHTVIFAITAGSEDTIAKLVRSLEKISFAQPAGPRSWPVCVSESDYKDYIAHTVDPVMTGPRYGSVPVRIIVGADGKLKHVHAFAGFPEQITSVTHALTKWEFKPYVIDGKPVEVETALLFEFPRAQRPRNAP